MNLIVQYLWLIPALPILAAGVTALAPRRQRALAATLAIGSMSLSFLLSLAAFAHVVGLRNGGQNVMQVVNFRWFQFGDQWLQLGWILDPLTAVMLLMVTFVALLVFIYSTGYMDHDENFTRFFCFLALFSGAMLGVILANSLLLLFMFWEVVGLTSYLLIGFWFFKPEAAAAAKKAFIVTRIGDLSLFLGMVWLAHQSGTLLFYDNGAGFLEPTALAHAVATTTLLGLTASTGIGLLIFGGAVGKSGQVPLHVWLPDAMEGPTPVSALIHAATMVAAGVFLVARVYPLMAASVSTVSPTVALEVITWVGAVTALFGASVALAHFDIKRILAYSTISQLGYMMMGLGVGGVSVGMFHLITHACFKALLFLGAGSVIHGCAGEQDIRLMGGLKKSMPITFATYMVGMLALCGFPFFFSGFWSKDEILHAAHGWSVSHVPFYMAAFAALLTAFYMTRQVCYIYAGASRLPHVGDHSGDEEHDRHPVGPAHESPRSMTIPLATLACVTVLLGIFGTPAWPWFQSFLENMPANANFAAFNNEGLLGVMLASSLIVFLGLGLGWILYGGKQTEHAAKFDTVQRSAPAIFNVLHRSFFVDEFYAATVVRLNGWLSRAFDWLDTWIWGGAVWTVSQWVLLLARLDNFFDTFVVNGGFDEGCAGLTRNGRILSMLQDGRVQRSLRAVGVGLVALALFLLWGARG